MTIERPEKAIEGPLDQLERKFIDEFLRQRGYDPARLQDLPEDELKRLMTAASLHAAAKLAEVESRAQYVHEIHQER